MKLRSETTAGTTTLYIGNDPIDHYDAVEIIRRVNAHDKLLEACKGWVNHFDSPGDGTDVSFEDEEALMDAMRAAIAAGEGTV